MLINILYSVTKSRSRNCRSPLRHGRSLINVLFGEISGGNSEDENSRGGGVEASAGVAKLLFTGEALPLSSGEVLDTLREEVSRGTRFFEESLPILELLFEGGRDVVTRHIFARLFANFSFLGEIFIFAAIRSASTNCQSLAEIRFCAIASQLACDRRSLAWFHGPTGISGDAFVTHLSQRARRRIPDEDDNDDGDRDQGD